MLRLGTRRDPALTLVFILLTCGIYYLYFIYKVSQEVSDFLGEQNYAPAVEVLLSAVTFGIWNIFWDYRMGKKMAMMCQRVHLPATDNAVLYLALDLCGFGGFGGLGLIVPIIQQDTLNHIWQAAMETPVDTPAGTWPPPPAAGDTTPRVPRPPL